MVIQTGKFDISVIEVLTICMYSLARKTLYIASGLLLLTTSFNPMPAKAASATLSLSPSSSSVSQGNTLTITVRVNSDEPINGVQANLSYPANLLDFVSIGSTSAFSVVAQNSGGGGSVQIGRGALPAVSGSQSVATVRFKAKTNAGTATISFAGGSSVASASSNSNIMTGSSGGNYTLKAPAVAAVVQEAPKDTVAPTIKDVRAVEITHNTAIITWTTSEPSSSTVEYGPTNAYGLVATDSTMVTEHKITLNSPAMIPATKYHFMVKSTDPAGNSVSGEDGTFSTKGAQLNVSVLNQNKKPVSGAKVTLAEKSAITDKNGKAQISDLPVGKVYGTVEFKGSKTVVSADIKPIDPKKVQELPLNIETKTNSPLVLIIPAILIGALLAIGYKRNWNSVIIRRLSKIKASMSTEPPITQRTVPDPPTISPTKADNEKPKFPK